ncbi:unnamed protein product [Blepharisma stoltei]|uniref:GrpE protein homolog n=1 Tax=Blepharisma stoltei TaxID=1481888 RepID=A0AAU9J5D7_9CILI|nr:unnamed protein product [Blepharisma stoltei]
MAARRNIFQLLSRSCHLRSATRQNFMGARTQRFFGEEQARAKEEQKNGEELKNKSEAPKEKSEKAGPESTQKDSTKDIDAKLQLMAEEANKYKDLYIRTLAEQENMRKRLQLEADNERTYAITKFAKEMLDVSDNLQRAIDNVPKEMKTPEDCSKAFDDLVKGVSMTRDIMKNVYKKFLIAEVDPLGQKFDPNLHEALFTFEDPAKQDGSVGNVVSLGYTINGRVLRSAKVGVIKNLKKA